jgi:C-terminal processing protease CtpA/Prc
MSTRRWARRTAVVALSLVALGLLAYGALLIPAVYFRVAFSTIQHNSLRRESVDWPAVWAEAHELAIGARTTADTYPAIRLVLTRLGDHHSHLLAPEAARATRTGSGWTPGLTVVWPERVVALVSPRGPAEVAGIQVGDVVETVNGSSPEHVAGVVSLFGRGPSIDLTLTRAGQMAPFGVRLTPRLTGIDQPAVVRGMDDGLAYVEIPALVGAGGTFAADAVAAIGRQDTPARCGWVVDLRRNVGGNMWPMLRAVRPLLGEGTPGYFVSGDRRVAWSYKSAVNGPVLKRPNPPVAVLTSRLTASSGEALTIAFRGRPLTRSFGEATGGVPTANESISLVDGALLLLTVASEADRTGRSYDGPIEPDERVAIDWARIGTDDDPVIRVAARWLRQQCAHREPASRADPGAAARWP